MKKLLRTKTSFFPEAFHCLTRSLKEQSKRRGLKYATESTAGIIPGDRGMVDGSWFRPPLHSAQAVRKAHLTSSSDRSRVRLSFTKKGVERQGVMRNHARAESGPRDVSTRAPTQSPQRVLVATAQTRTQSRHPAGPPRQKARFACEAGAKGRGDGGERANLAKFVKPPRWGGVKNHVTPLQERKQPER